MLFLFVLLSFAYIVPAFASAGSATSNETASQSIVHDLAQTLAKRTGVTTFELASPRIVERNDRLQVDLPIDGVLRRLDLRPSPVRAPDFRVRVQGSDGRLSEVTAPAPTVWTGALVDQPGSRAVLAWRDGRISGTITLMTWRRETWTVRPADELVAGAAAGTCVLYRADDVLPTAGTCGVETPPGEEPHWHDPAGKDATLAVQVCEVACDVDTEYFVANNSSVDDTVADIELIIAGVSALYELDLRVAFVITEILIRESEPDPYGTTNPNALLEAFSDEWRDNHDDVQRDVAHLFTGKDLDGTPIGIAWASLGICNSYYGYSLVQSHFSDDLAERVAVSAHEIGHNFDAVHCDYGGSWWCRVMCSSIGGCSAGIRSFGPDTLERVGDELPGLSCLEAGTAQIPTTSLPFFDAFTASGEPNPELWIAADLAKVIYQRLELEAGDTYGVNELGTIRTLPMTLSGAATVTFKVRSYGLPAGQPLRVEYFDSDTWQWVLLQTIIATGGSSSPLEEVQLAVPASAAGPYFAVRFSADGNGGDWNDEWHLDDVSIDQSTSSVPGLQGSGLITAVAPNPFNPQTTVTFNLAFAGPVDVTIRDLQGRLVKRLAKREFPAGEHRIAWSGRDDTGKPAASGAYLVQLVTADRVETAKVALLK